MRNKIPDFLPAVCLLLAALIVLWFRSNRLVGNEPQVPTRQIRVMGINEDGSFINEEFFRQHVWEPYKAYSQDSLINLFVFVDLSHECSGNLYESEVWADLANDVGLSVFKIHLFIPETVPPDLAASYAETYLLEPDQIYYYSNDQEIELFGRQGLFKVVWSLEEGYLWCEHGSSSPYDHDRTRAKLEALVLPLVASSQAVGLDPGNVPD